MGRKTVKYQDEILQALNLINQMPREINSQELVEVRCATCKEVHSKQKFWTILKRFKSRWYGWECKECSYERRRRVMKAKWDNPSVAKDIKEKIKTTARDRYGTDNPMQNEDVKEKRKQTLKKKRELR